MNDKELTSYFKNLLSYHFTALLSLPSPFSSIPFSLSPLILLSSVSASEALHTATNQAEMLYDKALPLFKRLTKDFKEGNDLRGLGVHLTKLKELYLLPHIGRGRAEGKGERGGDEYDYIAKQKEISSFFNLSSRESSRDCGRSCQFDSRTEIDPLESPLEKGDCVDRLDQDMKVDLDDDSLIKSLSDEEEESIVYTQLNNGSNRSHFMEELAKPLRYSQIDSSILEELPPEIIQEFKDSSSSSSSSQYDNDTEDMMRAADEYSSLYSKYGQSLTSDQIRMLREFPESLHEEVAFQLSGKTSFHPSESSVPPHSSSLSSSSSSSSRSMISRRSVKRKHIQTKIYDKHTRTILFQRNHGKHSTNTAGHGRGYTIDNVVDIHCLHGMTIPQDSQQLSREVLDSEPVVRENGFEAKNAITPANKAQADVLLNLKNLLNSMLSSSMPAFDSSDVIYIIVTAMDAIKEGDVDECIKKITQSFCSFGIALVQSGRSDSAVLFLKLIKSRDVVGSEFFLNTENVGMIESAVQRSSLEKNRAKLVLT